MRKSLIIGIPKGSLQESTLSLFAGAGLSFYGSERSLRLTSNDPEIQPVLLRPQEIPRYVADGSLDCGLSGLDWIKETDCEDKVRILADLCYSKRSFRPVRWVLAVSIDSEFKTLDDLKRKGRSIKVSTELEKITTDWFAKRHIPCEVDFSWGATEVKPPEFADAIVDATETGASLKANRLIELAELCVSTTQFFANKGSYRDDSWKRTKLDGIALLLKSCLAADSKVSINVEVPRPKLEMIKSLIPADASFSVWNSNEHDILLQIIVDKTKTRELLPVFATTGAKRISVASIDMLYE